MLVVERVRESGNYDSLRQQQGKKDEMKHAPLLLSSSLRASKGKKRCP